MAASLADFKLKNLFRLNRYAGTFFVSRLAAQVNRDVLLAAMKDRTLGSAELSFTYDRTGLTTKEGGKDAPPEPTKEPRRQPH